MTAAWLMHHSLLATQVLPAVIRMSIVTLVLRKILMRMISKAWVVERHRAIGRGEVELSVTMRFTMCHIQATNQSELGSYVNSVLEHKQLANHVQSDSSSGDSSYETWISRSMHDMGSAIGAHHVSNENKRQSTSSSKSFHTSVVSAAIDRFNDSSEVFDGSSSRKSILSMSAHDSKVLSLEESSFAEDLTDGTKFEEVYNPKYESDIIHESDIMVHQGLGFNLLF